MIDRTKQKYRASTGYCGIHGRSFYKTEGCADCVKACEMPLIALVNRVYDRHVKPTK